MAPKTSFKVGQKWYKLSLLFTSITPVTSYRIEQILEGGKDILVKQMGGGGYETWKDDNQKTLFATRCEAYQYAAEFYKGMMDICIQMATEKE